MKHFKILGLALSLTFALVACNRDETYIPKGAYENGIVIVNEGNFGKPNGDISFVDNSLTKVGNNIYKATNNEDLGDVIQNIGFNGSDVYIVANNSNKVIVADRYTMKKKLELTAQIKQPRYITFAGNKAYITNNSTKSVSVYNTQNYSFVKNINIDYTVERIVTAGNNIFVQNAAYGSGNKLTIINSVDNNVNHTFSVPKGNIQKTISYKGSVYVITGKSGEKDSQIYQYGSTGNLQKTITLEGISNAKNLAIDQDNIYFTSGTGVYTMPLSSTTAPKEPVFNVTNNSWSTLYGFDVIDGKIYTADAKGFTQSSEVTVYSPKGEVLKTFTSGIGTNGFYKN